MADITIILAAYILGSFSTGYWLVRFQKSIDIRGYGSGNIGAKNVGRLLGRSGFMITFLGDTLKAIVIVNIAQALNYSLAVVCLCTFAVISGHIWSLFLRFQGGKGVATALGAFLALDYYIIAMICALFISSFIILRKINTSALITALTIPIALFLLNFDSYTVITVTASSIIVLYAHRSNIRGAFTKKATDENDFNQ